MRPTRRISWLLAIVVPTVVVALLTAQTKRKGTQYAFLVACSGYDKNELKSLPYTIKEMEEFRDALLAGGYESVNVKLLHDKQSDRRYLPEKIKILRQFDLLLARVGPEDSLLVAFNGHGVQFRDDKSGYFCPIDASLEDKKTLVPTEGEEGLFERLKKCKAKRKLLIVNACRNDPASERAQAARKINLEDRDDDRVPEGVAALYSCKAGQKSYYYDPEDAKSKGRERSLFFHHVIESWKGAYGSADKLMVEDFFRLVREKTAADADNLFDRPQTPVVRREYIGEGEWLLRGRVQALAARILTLELADGVKMHLVRIPKGKFLMGSPDDEKERNKDEVQHEVEITRDFYLGKYEVTRGQFRAFVEAEGYRTEAETDGLGGQGYDAEDGKFKGPILHAKTGRWLAGTKSHYTWKNAGFAQTDEHPVMNVSWNDATAFCQWLARKSGRAVRLPSEAEWEYSCRAGTKTRFYSGDDVETLARVGNVADGTAKKKFSNWPTIEGEDGYVFTAPVGHFEPNRFGLYDMHGNVFEWCQDWYGPYEGLSEKDPLRTQKVDYLAHMLRGGSWDGGPRGCRAANRNMGTPRRRSGGVGFRAAFRLD